MNILSIESSCDETAASIVESGRIVHADIVSSQAQLHAKWGGVVPEIASRNHLVDIIRVVDEALSVSGCQWTDIDAVAVTQGPGLVGSLLVGIQTAKSLAYAHRKPLIPVHHLIGHLNAIALHHPHDTPPPLPPYPHLALLVSGGHTALYRVNSPLEVELKSNTRDDAAGEAFDKVARMLGLGYPGGPHVERIALKGDDQAYRFTLPRLKKTPLDFSFSGLKTAVLTYIKKHGALPQEQTLYDLVASFEKAAVDQLVHRTFEVMEHEKLSSLVIAGGVACNQRLRTTLQEECHQRGCSLFLPPKRWCTDNSAMIGAAAFHLAHSHIQKGAQREDLDLNAKSTWMLHQRKTSL